jgi:hypothetical protein
VTVLPVRARVGAQLGSIRSLIPPCECLLVKELIRATPKISITSMFYQKFRDARCMKPGVSGYARSSNSLQRSGTEARNRSTGRAADLPIVKGYGSSA